MEDNSIRRKQRFQKHENALHHLEDAMNLQNPDIFQRAGMIQFFEMCCELSWKLLKIILKNRDLPTVKPPALQSKNHLKLV